MVGQLRSVAAACVKDLYSDKITRSSHMMVTVRGDGLSGNSGAAGPSF